MRIPFSVFGLAVLTFGLLSAQEKEKPTLADDLQKIQGEWTISSIFFANDHDRLPATAKLNQKGITFKIEGNDLLHDGKKVATLNNNVAEAPQAKEIGWIEHHRLLKLTLADGKSYWCSYGFREDRFQLTYPHTTSCHRGSGQIVYFSRPAADSSAASAP